MRVHTVISSGCSDAPFATSDAEVIASPRGRSARRSGVCPSCMQHHGTRLMRQPNSGLCEQRHHHHTLFLALMSALWLRKNSTNPPRSSSTQCSTVLPSFNVSCHLYKSSVRILDGVMVRCPLVHESEPIGMCVCLHVHCLDHERWHQQREAARQSACSCACTTTATASHLAAVGPKSAIHMADWPQSFSRSRQLSKSQCVKPSRSGVHHHRGDGDRLGP